MTRVIDPTEWVWVLSAAVSGSVLSNGPGFPCIVFGSMIICDRWALGGEAKKKVS